MLDASLGLYGAIMKTSAGSISGRQREMLATVVSRVNDCHNYINRVADAVHVELEPEMPSYPDGSR